MTTFELVNVIGCVCAVIMVLGSMILLYKGIITLKEKSKNGLSVEFKKFFKITSTYPALGLFVIGLIFFAIAVYSLRPPDVKPIDVEGSVKVSDPESVIIKMSFQPKMIIPGSDGNIKTTFIPDQKILTVEAVAPGYSKPNVKKDILVAEKVTLGNFEFGELLAQKPVIDPANIITVDEQLPPLSNISF